MTKYVIWSEEHQAWWMSNRHGYTRSLDRAGRYSKEEATEICQEANEHCRPGEFNEVAIPDPSVNKSVDKSLGKSREKE